MKKLLAAALGAAFVAALVAVSLPASAGTTSQYMHPKSSLRYHVVSYVLAGNTTDVTAAVIGAVPPGRHTLKCISMHQLTAGTANTWSVTPKANGVALVSTAGTLTSDSLATSYLDNATCPMPDPASSATTAYVRPVLAAAAGTLAGGETLTMDVDFLNTAGTAPTGLVRLYLEPSH